MSETTIIALFIDHDGTDFTVVPYEKGAHSMLLDRFLYWEGESGTSPLLVGSSAHPSLCDHQIIGRIIAVEFRGYNDPEIRRAAFPIAKRNCITGAGRIEEGDVVSWESMGYALETPSMLRSVILTTLGLK